MFLRQTARYNEVLESYRHPRSRRSTHRTIARWPRDRSLEDELASLVADYEAALAIRAHFGRTQPRSQEEVQAYAAAIALVPTIGPQVEKLIAARDGLAASEARRRERED